MVHAVKRNKVKSSTFYCKFACEGKYKLIDFESLGVIMYNSAIFKLTSLISIYFSKMLKSSVNKVEKIPFLKT